MITILRREPIFKKIFIIAVLSISLIFSVFTYFQYNNLKSIYKEQNEINKRIVGTLVNKYPEDEIDIVKSIYYVNDDYKEFGEKILSKLGYDDNYEMSENINFTNQLSTFMITNIIGFLVISTLIILLLFSLVKYVFKNLEELSRVLQKIINNGDYSEIKSDDYGIFSVIYSDLNKLSRSLHIKIINLDKEKESIKELVTDISHQLKTPLASLKLYNTLLIEEEIDEEDKLEFLKTNEMCINKLHNLIDSLVNISRMEAGMISIKKENKNIKETINRAISSIKVKADIKNINIDYEDFKDNFILHDSKWTEECIFNILDNCVKYTDENGEIKLSVNDTINFIRIDIEDNGIGIDSSKYNDIFKRFYRIEEVENIEGSGVGLYLSRKILERQGGNIIVSSKKGIGSKFSLFLTKV